MHGYNFNDLNLPKVVENPYSGEQLQVFSAVSSHLSILRLDERQTQQQNTVHVTKSHKISKLQCLKDNCRRSNTNDKLTSDH
jgi:hypothetical protein